MIDEHPEVFWGVIASMYIGNILLLALNLPLIRLFVQVLRLRGSLMAPIILVVAICGVFSVRNSLFDVGVAIFFGIVGYLLRKASFDLGPFILGFILGPILEVQFRRTMLISEGDFGIFLDRPLSLAVMLIIFAFIVQGVLAKVRERQRRLRETSSADMVYV